MKAITGPYLITKTGLEIQVGKVGDEIRKKIEESDNPLAYRFYDEDKRTWAYVAVAKNNNGKGNEVEIEPFIFPGPEQYGVTSAELYAKTVTYPIVLAQVIEIITRKAPTLWERIAKPTTIITAIVLVILIMGIMVVGLSG